MDMKHEVLKGYTYFKNFDRQETISENQTCPMPQWSYQHKGKSGCGYKCCHGYYKLQYIQYLEGNSLTLIVTTPLLCCIHPKVVLLPNDKHGVHDGLQSSILCR